MSEAVCLVANGGAGAAIAGTWFGDCSGKQDTHEEGWKIRLIDTYD